MAKPARTYTVNKTRAEEVEVTSRGAEVAKLLPPDDDGILRATGPFELPTRTFKLLLSEPSAPDIRWGNGNQPAGLSPAMEIRGGIQDIIQDGRR